VSAIGGRTELDQLTDDAPVEIFAEQIEEKLSKES
jgi:hypothetical protein